MKTKISVKTALYALSTSWLLASCQKGDEITSSNVSTASSSTIAVATTISSNTRVGDSVYLLQSCSYGEVRDSIAQADLPAAVSNYIATNYSGATFSQAYALKNSSSEINGYVVIIYYNNNPVGLQFDNTGNFVKVLEQREKGDLGGSGWHHGGRFEHRDGLQKDTIALSALPSSISSYFSFNYTSDTLVKAFTNWDRSIVVISKNNGLYATVFTSDGTYVSRAQLPSKAGIVQSIDLSALPSSGANYLTETYPNYVFEKAFSIVQNGSILGYVVIIDANNTKYAVAFDAGGNFLKAKTIH